jgi:hypothetical protein
VGSTPSVGTKKALRAFLPRRSSQSEAGPSLHLHPSELRLAGQLHLTGPLARSGSEGCHVVHNEESMATFADPAYATIAVA